MAAYQRRLNEILTMIGTDNLSFNEEESVCYEKTFAYIEDYARERCLVNTAVAIRVVRTLHDGMYRGTMQIPSGQVVNRPYVCHCYSVCRMLMNLHLQLEPREEDIMLTAALCHDLPAFIPTVKNEHAMVNVYHLDPAAEELVFLIYTRDCHTDADFEALFRRVERNKLGALIKLADRGNVVEELFNFSVWRANEYIHETRTYYIPMCIHGMELYPELDRALGILQEKLHDIISATEIFMDRFIKLDKERMTQILVLTEDNARMRARIAHRERELGEKVYSE